MIVTKGYENKTVQAVRGTEDKTIAKWETAGWQLVSRDQGTFRTALIFRRSKLKKNLPAAAALAFLLPVAVGGLTLGLIFGDDKNTTAPPTAATASSPPRRRRVTGPPLRTDSFGNRLGRDAGRPAHLR
ncbi:hypothetical protein [uncultured Modestobacter sp.]|uniref:hypothetical protein n=1 Tax=uncultured Modestobacter sp. TaxID=380048 RepID=UPI00260C4171|nr:hypothetical protein [uncultured Modestobacter sp.]